MNFLKKKRLLAKSNLIIANLWFETGIEYKGIEAENIIFCEGFKINQNPYFNYVPLKPNKRGGS